MSNPQNKDRSSTKIGKIFVIGIISVFLLVGLMLVTIQPQQTKEDIIEEENSIEYAEISNSKEIYYSDQKFVLPEGWNIASQAKGIFKNDYICESPDNYCEVFEIENISKGLKFYISKPSFISFPENVLTIESLKETAFFGEKTDFLYKEVVQAIELEGKLYYQVSGCFNVALCLSSGIIDLTPENNVKAVFEFNSLAENLKFE